MKKIFTYNMLLMSMFLFTACPSNDDDDDSKNIESVTTSTSRGLYCGGKPITLYEFNKDGTVRQATFKFNDSGVKDDVFTYSYFPDQIRVDNMTLTLQNGRVTKLYTAGILLFEYEYDSKGYLARVIEYDYLGRKFDEWGVTWKNGNIVSTSQYGLNHYFVFVPSETSASIAHDGRYNPLIYALWKDRYSLYSMRWAFALVQYFGTQPQNLAGQVLGEEKDISVYNDKLQKYVKADIMKGPNFAYEQQGEKLTKVRQNIVTLDKDGNHVTQL